MTAGEAVQWHDAIGFEILICYYEATSRMAEDPLKTVLNHHIKIALHNYRYNKGVCRIFFMIIYIKK